MSPQYETEETGAKAMHILHVDVGKVLQDKVCRLDVPSPNTIG